MASRRDQLHSYQFMNQRVISAFVMRETDPAQSPLRRGIGALFGGLMVAILIAAGFGIYGVLTRTGADQWQREGSVVVERESGAGFVYLQGRLNPTLNLTSAKLASGRPNPAVYRVAATSLAGTPRGITIGIPGAPASLPAAGRQARLPWAMCAVSGDTPRSILLVGTSGPAGTALGDRALLTTDAGNDGVHLIWQGRKHLIPKAGTVKALFGEARPARVGTGWLNALPSGADIAPITLNGAGNESNAAPGFGIGDVLVTETGSGPQFYLVLDDGRGTITPFQQAVLKGESGQDPKPIAVNALTGIPESGAFRNGEPGLRGPDQVPELATAGNGTSTCAVTIDAGKPPTVTIGDTGSAFNAAIPTGGSTGDRPLADAVQVPAGRFALVRVPGSGTFMLVTDVALRHAIPTAEALGFLGYTPALAIAIPTALVNSIPAGATLDPTAALRPAPNPN